MKRRAKANGAPPTVKLTYDSQNGTWSSTGSVKIPRSGMVKFDLDPASSPNCDIQCNPTTPSPDSPIIGGGFTIGVGSGMGGGGKKRSSGSGTKKRRR